MNGFAGELDQTERDIFVDDVSDDALERAADMTTAANPTVPSALVCIPFEAERQ